MQTIERKTPTIVIYHRAKRQGCERWHQLVLQTSLTVLIMQVVSLRFVLLLLL